MMKYAKAVVVSVSQENEIEYVEVEIVEFVFQCSPGFLTIKIFLNLLQIDETLVELPLPHALVSVILLASSSI